MNRQRRREIFAWCLFDFGQSAFSTIIVTFIFSAYFARMIAINKVDGIADFAWAMSLSGLLVAILSPFIGAIADHTSRKKPWIFTFTLLSALFTGLLFFAQPFPSYAIYALALFVAANTIIEISQVFYNAYLPLIAPRKMFGEISGYGWGSGYIGGLLALVVSLCFFVQAHFVSHNQALNIRSTTLMAAAWILIFCAPFFAIVKDHYLFDRKESHVIRSGIKNVFETFKSARKHKVMFRFLIARLVYTDGVNTLLSLGGVFAALIFDMPFQELLLFGIVMNISAGLGAFLLARLSDIIGSARMVALSLLAIIALGALVIATHHKVLFWVGANALALFVGPVQSASRSFMAELAPKEMLTQMFGLYALSGKVTSFVAPFLVALITRLSHSERIGMSSVFVLMLVGLVIIFPIVKKER